MSLHLERQHSTLALTSCEPSANYLIAMCLSFLNYKIETIIILTNAMKIDIKRVNR